MSASGGSRYGISGAAESTFSILLSAVGGIGRCLRRSSYRNRARRNVDLIELRPRELSWRLKSIARTSEARGQLQSQLQLGNERTENRRRLQAPHKTSSKVFPD
jgi:hypothetical protein